MITNIFIVALSLIIGSFLNVLIHRIPRRESCVWPGSHCPECQNRLGIRDMIPVVSYIWLRGRCRYCGRHISLRYPTVEVLTAVLFLLVFSKYGFSMQTAAGWILTGLLIIGAFIDIEQGIIPNRITYPGMVVGIIMSFFTIGIASSLIGCILYGAVLMGAALVSRGGMGGGDVKMAGAIGAFLGCQWAVLALFLSSLLGGIWGAALLITGKATRKSAIKFGPFLSLGAWLVWMYGQQMIDFYISLF